MSASRDTSPYGFSQLEVLAAMAGLEAGWLRAYLVWAVQERRRGVAPEDLRKLLVDNWLREQSALEPQGVR